MQIQRKIQTDNTFHWILLPTLVLIALLSGSLFLFSNAQAEEQFCNTTQTVTQTKIPNQVSSEDSPSKIPENFIGVLDSVIVREEKVIDLQVGSFYKDESWQVVKYSGKLNFEKGDYSLYPVSTMWTK